MTRTRLRTAAVALTVAAATALGAGAASAHTKVVKTSPAAGKTAKTSVKKVVVTFSGGILTGKLRVTGPGGTVSVGQGGRDRRSSKRLLVSLKRGLKPGRYKASWGIVGSDGHNQNGSFSFTLRR